MNYIHRRLVPLLSRGQKRESDTEYQKQPRNPHVHNCIARLRNAYEQFGVAASHIHLSPILDEFPLVPVKDQ